MHTDTLRMFAVAMLLLFALTFPCAGGDGVYMITEFGAEPGGRILCTGAIQRAVDECHAHGGGTVLVPAGTFVTGSVRLLGAVHLHLESGAVLLGSRDMSDYYRSGIRRGMLYADDAVDITLSGPGCIDGGGSAFFRAEGLNPPGIDTSYTRQRGEYMNPKDGLDEGPIAFDVRPGMMVDFLRCSNISLRDITLKDSPEYAVRFGTCENVTVAGVTVANNPLTPNNDGIHCTTSRNVRICGCHIVAGDDAIIVTGFPYEMDSTGKAASVPATYGNRTGRAEYVTVTNCTLSSRSAGIRVGYGRNDIRDCTFQNIVIENSNRGIGVFARDTGSVRNILFSNIVIETRLFTGGWWGAGEPIHVSAIAQTRGAKVGRIENITFDNIVAESESGILLYGTENNPLEHIVLNNVRLLVRAGRLSRSYGGNIDLRPAWGGEVRVFSHDLPGLYGRCLRDSRIDHFDLTWQGDLPDFYTSGIGLERCFDITIRDFRGGHAPGAPQAKGVEVHQCSRIRTLQ
jgi:polygalacturonase